MIVSIHSWPDCEGVDRRVIGVWTAFKESAFTGRFDFLISLEHTGHDGHKLANWPPENAKDRNPNTMPDCYHNILCST